MKQILNDLSIKDRELEGLDAHEQRFGLNFEVADRRNETLDSISNLEIELRQRVDVIYHL